MTAPSTPRPQPLSASLARLASEERSGSARVGVAVAAIWQDIDARLSPVIGKQGVAALYQRSVALASRTHPWLADTHAGVAATVDLAAIERVLGSQAPLVAAAGGGAVLDAFWEILSDMVGESLTVELLGAVWAAAPEPSARGEQHP